MQNQLANAPTDGPLIDTFGRIADDLRISVTDRCNFRCTYCMPAEGLQWLPKEEILTFEELTRLLALFVGLGVRGAQGDGRGAHGPRRPPEARPDVPRGRPGARHLDHDERAPARPPRRAAGRGRRGPRDGLLRFTAAAPLRRDDAARRARQGPRRDPGRGVGRPRADQDQHGRDRRHERRRGRRLRAMGARDRLRGAVHRVHAAGRTTRMGAREGRARRSDPRGDRRRVPARRTVTTPPSPRRPTGSPTTRPARSV